MNFLVDCYWRNPVFVDFGAELASFKTVYGFSISTSSAGLAPCMEFQRAKIEGECFADTWHIALGWCTIFAPRQPMIQNIDFWCFLHDITILSLIGKVRAFITKVFILLEWPSWLWIRISVSSSSCSNNLRLEPHPINLFFEDIAGGTQWLMVWNRCFHSNLIR